MIEPLRHVEGVSSWDLKPGEFSYRRAEDGKINRICFWPADCPCPLKVPISPQRNSNGATWTLLGTLDAPTLQPSVNAVNIWHGRLTDGVARKC
jgi:hypothetical protein